MWYELTTDVITHYPTCLLQVLGDSILYVTRNTDKKKVLFYNDKSNSFTVDEGKFKVMEGDMLTHWGWLTNICVSELTIIDSDNGLSPGRRHAIIWSNAGILLIGPLGTNFSDILIKIHTFSFKKMCLKVSSAKWRPFCLSLSVLRCFCCIMVNDYLSIQRHG